MKPHDDYSLTSKEERAMKRRAVERRKRIVGNVAKNFAKADQWDLEFWQKQTPEMRLLTVAVVREHVRMMPGRNKMFDHELEPDWAEQGYREIFGKMKSNLRLPSER